MHIEFPFDISRLTIRVCRPTGKRFFGMKIFPSDNGSVNNHDMPKY